MNYLIKIILFTLLTITQGFAAEYGTAKEAEALVGKAAKHIKDVGKDKAFAEFTAKKGWIDRDLYVMVYDLNGKVLAHGQNEKQVGMDMLGFKDPTGKEFIKERIELAKSKPKFWQEYQFTDPITKSIKPKSVFCERHEEIIVCSGIYKR